MPKIKTHSGSAKRFKATGSSVKRKQSHTSHILTKKSPKRKRQLRGTAQLHAADSAIIAKVLPYL
jgi:large subunit ribosomal protein L35